MLCAAHSRCCEINGNILILIKGSFDKAITRNDLLSTKYIMQLAQMCSGLFNQICVLTCCPEISNLELSWLNEWLDENLNIIRKQQWKYLGVIFDIQRILSIELKTLNYFSNTSRFSLCFMCKQADKSVNAARLVISYLFYLLKGQLKCDPGSPN